MKTIIITRVSKFGYFRKLSIFADDTFICRISAGRTRKVQLPNGAKVIYGSIDGARTAPLDVDTLQNGDEIRAISIKGSPASLSYTLLPIVLQHVNSRSAPQEVKVEAINNRN